MAQREKPRCRHCQAAPVSRPRGLCWKCFYTPAIRALYPPADLPQGVLDGFGERPLPAKPTAARPGTAEKVEVLCQRARLRQNLWHPEDAC
jgi:hypothetical protein